MEARYALRKSQLLDECQIAPEIFEQVMPRLYTFMKPFVRSSKGQAAASTRQNLCLWPAVERRTQKHRIDCLSFWPVAPAAARLHWLGRVGRCTLATGVAGPSQDALGTRRWGVGVRSFWVSQVRSGVGGGGPAVVWPPGQSR